MIMKALSLELGVFAFLGRKEMERKPLKTKKVDVSIEKPTTSTWADTLTYLARVIDPKDIPNYTILIGLASYARSNDGLTNKQTKIAQDLLDYAQERGII